MAEKEIKERPKKIIEAVPEEIERLEKDPEVREVLEIPEPEEKELEKDEIDKRLKHLDRKEKEGIKEHIKSWNPKTNIGKLVKEGKLNNIDEILEKHRSILEPEIVEALLDIDSELILIGQAKGKFGGGKRRAWRQTQKKTQEGNILTFSSMVAVGDKNGHVGLGYGKSKETLPAREKALRKAKLNIIKIRRGFENPRDEAKEDPHTVPFRVEGKCGSSKVVLIPAPRGTGLAIGDECKKILKLAGVNDVYSQTGGQTRTTFNVAKACINALSKTTQIK